MRNCSLELQLFPPSASSSESIDLPDQALGGSSTRDQITIFHNMRPVCACDATELQAIVILWLARRETEDKLVPTMQVQLHVPSGLSLKKSLRRFLQKRNDRIQSAIPYKRTFFRKSGGVFELKDRFPASK